MGFHRRPAPQLACKRSTDRQQPGREDYELNREGRDVGVPSFCDDRERRLERLVAVFIVGGAPIEGMAISAAKKAA